MSELDSIRASDAERDAAATRLQAAFAEGRIDVSCAVESEAAAGR
jgi:Domain of unknown function (DUF1707)